MIEMPHWRRTKRRIFEDVFKKELWDRYVSHLEETGIGKPPFAVEADDNTITVQVDLIYTGEEVGLEDRPDLA